MNVQSGTETELFVNMVQAMLGNVAPSFNKIAIRFANEEAYLYFQVNILSDEAQNDIDAIFDDLEAIYGRYIAIHKSVETGDLYSDWAGTGRTHVYFRKPSIEELETQMQSIS